MNGEPRTKRLLRPRFVVRLLRPRVLSPCVAPCVTSQRDNSVTRQIRRGDAACPSCKCTVSAKLKILIKRRTGWCVECRVPWLACVLPVCDSFSVLSVSASFVRFARVSCPRLRFDVMGRDWRRMGVVSESVAYGFLVASYRRRMGLVAVREMARHRYRQSQFVGLTRLQLDEIGRERQVQRQGAQRAEARAELSVELAQARILPAYELGR